MRRSGKKREILVCQRVADEINSTEGTDYRAISCGSEFPDVLLVSDSGKHVTREAEVVSTPQDSTIRYDNKNVEHFERRLRGALEKLGVSNCLVSVSWSRSAIRSGVDENLISELADIIASTIRTSGYLVLRGIEVYKHSPEVSRILNYVITFRLPCSALKVRSIWGFWVPPDGRWIEEAVAKKIGRYRSGAAGRTLLLVIDGLAHIDGEQLKAFRAGNPVEKIPFAELWVVTMGKAYRVKP